ncbi:hypothetical protein AB1Y20_004883 [Prymnesium parvum]|uniref:Uncharacterized protein n=1 Tax=Prymnesium parvum TaxID=97485 RepID=A0AB34J0H1_PRYPA
MEVAVGGDDEEEDVVHVRAEPSRGRSLRTLHVHATLVPPKRCSSPATFSSKLSTPSAPPSTSSATSGTSAAPSPGVPSSTPPPARRAPLDMPPPKDPLPPPPDASSHSSSHAATNGSTAHSAGASASASHAAPPLATDAAAVAMAEAQLEQAHPLLSAAAMKWVRTFTDGLREHTACLSFADGALTLELHGELRAEIATRSRVPVAFELERQVRLTPRCGADGEAVLGIEGLIIAPVDGAAEIYARCKTLWDGVPSLQARGQVAWNWWQIEGHKAEYEHTKFWRVIESLAGLKSAMLAVPRRGLEDLLLGCVCVTRTRPLHLRYSFFSKAGAAAAPSKADVQVTCTAPHDPSALSPSSPLYDPDCEWKQQTAQAIALHVCQTNRELAERFARSGINFSLLFNASDMGVRGASPDAVCKLFEVSKAVGGANSVDRSMGALRWQRDDITFRMTGEHGRIMWLDNSGSKR